MVRRLVKSDSGRRTRKVRTVQTWPCGRRCGLRHRGWNTCPHDAEHGIRLRGADQAAGAALHAAAGGAGASRRMYGPGMGTRGRRAKTAVGQAGRDRQWQQERLQGDRIGRDQRRKPPRPESFAHGLQIYAPARRASTRRPPRANLGAWSRRALLRRTANIRSCPSAAGLAVCDVPCQHRRLSTISPNSRAVTTKMTIGTA